MLAALLLLAQVAGSPVPAYTTFDPDGLGLATPDGRYTLTLDAACPLGPLDNVAVWPSSDEPGYLTFSAQDGTQGCPILGLRRISDVPCATNDLGQCDVAKDHN